MDYLSEYHVRIKEKLAAVVKSYNEAGFTVSYEKISYILAEQYGLEVSVQKLRKMFDKDDATRKIQLAEAAAICDIFGISLNELCQFPSAPSRELNPSWLIPKDKNVEPTHTVLSNPMFHGKYYCYYYKPKMVSNARLGKKCAALETQIHCAELEIGEKSGFSYATLTEKTPFKNTYWAHPDEESVYSGKVYLLENPNQVYMMMQDKGAMHFMTLVFEYQNYAKSIMYYRTAAMLTSSNFNKMPIYEKMVILREKLDLSDETHLELIRGMLTLTGHKVMVKKDMFESLCGSRSELKELPFSREEYYVFNENEILNHHCDLDYNSKKSSILFLRQNSELPVQSVTVEDEDFHEMIRDFQQELKSMAN